MTMDCRRILIVVCILVECTRALVKEEEGCTTDADCQRGGDSAAYCKGNGFCRCDLPYYGELCQNIHCPGDPECSSHGTCDSKTGTCSCDAPWSGSNCSVVQCPGPRHNCSYPNGICDRQSGACHCVSPYVGAACDQILCPKNCSNHGSCDSKTGTCNCDEGWTGDACDTPGPSPSNCSICAGSYCKCNLDQPLCQGSNTKCDACCGSKPVKPTKVACDVGASPPYPPESLAYTGRCDPNTSERPSGSTLLKELMSPLPYDADTWPHYDDAFNYAGSDGNGGVKNGNFTLYWGVRPDPNAAASVFASNEADGWYAAWLNMSDMYRDCSRACDADNWTLVATKGDFEACETSFNVPEYQFVEMSEKGDAKKITLPEWKFGPITDAEPWVVDFSEGLDGELGMVTSLNGQGIAIPDPETGHWHDNVQIVWDDTAPTSAINASSGVDPKRGKYVAKLDTYVSYRGENESWVIDSTGGLVTGKQFVSGAFEITAKVPQSSGQVFAIWLFNGAKSWSAHVPYASKENTSDKTCFAPSDGCTFFNMSSCVDVSDPARCPFDPSLDEETCRNAGGAYVDKSTAPFTCLDNGRTPYQSYSGDPLWIDRLESPGNELPQLCKEFPNAEIDWEFPSNAPDTTRGPPFAPHSCEKPSSGGTPCDRTTKYNTSNINNYRFTDGSGEGTYTNIWVERSGGDFIDGQWHTYRIEVHTGTEGGCEPRVDYFFDGEYVGTNNAMVPRVAGRLWVLLMDRTTWSSGSGGWNGLLNTTGLNSSEALSVYSSVMVSEIRAEPFFEERDTYAPQPYDQPSMGVGYLADCGKKNPPTELDSSFVGYYTDDSSDRKIGNIKWIKRKED